MTKTSVARISISLPPNLLAEFNNVTASIGYDRSKAIQQAMRDFISEYQREYEPLAQAVGTITLIYDHAIPELEADLTDVQHRFFAIVSSTTHIHLDSNHCLLVIIVKGPAEKIHELSSELRRLRGIHQLKLTSLMVASSQTKK